uniref:Cell death abnormality protein 1-like isoform X1 n=1 Tax=Crassostrea virginica TaxID=6565 RepID=A0A8B8B0E1_CRAVI|nr:cell death abnormality protein 1-like isoform X1 [Crassostrea virginica]
MPSTHKPKLTNNGTKECFPNYYLNGDICTECPLGYYDVNCSLPCPPPTYGRCCAEHCSCSSASCHHVYGCNETAECPAEYFGDNRSCSCPPLTYGDGCAENCSCSHASCHHVYGCNMTTGKKYAIYPQTNISKRRNEGMLSLLLFKRRHLYRCDLKNVLLDIMMMIAPYPVPHLLMDATVLNNVLVQVHHVTMSMDAT